MKIIKYIDDEGSSIEFAVVNNSFQVSIMFGDDSANTSTFEFSEVDSLQFRDDLYDLEKALTKPEKIREF